MKFNPDSEYEVKSGEPFDVNVPSGDIFVILTKAYLRDVSEEIDETIILHIIVDGKSFVAGTLHPQKRREQVLQIPIDKNFQISHTSTNGSVHFSAKNILKNIEYLACVCSVITSAESDADCDDDEKKETANKEEGPASEFAHRHFCKFYNKWFKTQALLSIAIVAVAIARYVRTKPIDAFLPLAVAAAFRIHAFSPAAPPIASPIDRQGEDMDVQFKTIEARLQSFLSQFQSELGVLDRIVHKNKNQHRRSSYFQYLLKVRRDCKLLQSTNLEEIVNSSFLIINGNRPKQKVQLLESLKRRKCDGGKHNFLVRLQGAARLLSQMVQPMMKAAIEISTLLARSFFMGFSMTILALLARLRVLTQQILLDVVLVFNMVSSLSQKQHSVKLNQEGIEVYREYYPKNEEEVVFLECIWENDKFVLLERKTEPDINKIQETTNGDVICEGLSTVEYQSIETILGAEKPVDTITDKPSEENPTTIKTENLSSMENLTHDCKQDDNQNAELDHVGVLEPSSKNQEQEQITRLNLLDHSDSLKPKPDLKKKVAFVSVKRPEPVKGNETVFPVKPSDGVNGEKQDLFFSLLTGGI